MNFDYRLDSLDRLDRLDSLDRMDRLDRLDRLDRTCGLGPVGLDPWAGNGTILLKFFG